MKYNGLTFDDFKKCLDELEALLTLNDNISHLMYLHGKQYNDYCEFCCPTSANTIIWLLALILEDTGDWIHYWCFEREFGERHIDIPVIGQSGTMYPLNTAEDLWNLLAAERRVKGAK